MTTSPRQETPVEVFSEEPLDIFYFYMGLLRNTIKEVSPDTWRSLLKDPPLPKKGPRNDLQTKPREREIEGTT